MTYIPEDKKQRTIDAATEAGFFTGKYRVDFDAVLLAMDKEDGTPLDADAWATFRVALNGFLYLYGMDAHANLADALLLQSLHVQRLAAKNIPEARRGYSLAWLKVNGAYG